MALEHRGDLVEQGVGSLLDARPSRREMYPVEDLERGRRDDYALGNPRRAPMVRGGPGLVRTGVVGIRDAVPVAIDDHRRWGKGQGFRDGRRLGFSSHYGRRRGHGERPLGAAAAGRGRPGEAEQEPGAGRTDAVAEGASPREVHREASSRADRSTQTPLRRSSAGGETGAQERSALELDVKAARHPSARRRDRVSQRTAQAGLAPGLHVEELARWPYAVASRSSAPAGTSPRRRPIASSASPRTVPSLDRPWARAVGSSRESCVARSIPADSWRSSPRRGVSRRSAIPESSSEGPREEGGRRERSPPADTVTGTSSAIERGPIRWTCTSSHWVVRERTTAYSEPEDT